MKEKSNNITELVFILDRSGSMSGLESDTIGGFNAMIQKQKKEDGEAYVSTILFDNVSEALYDRIKLRNVPKIQFAVAPHLLMRSAAPSAILEISISMHARKMFLLTRCLSLLPMVRKTQAIILAVMRLKK